MKDGDLVMIDFGAEYGYYASDITRTVPVNGKFTSEQATIYNIVLEAHKNAINSAKPGISYYDLYWQNVEFILEQLINNNIVQGNKNDLIATWEFRKYIVAGLGHCIGLDVHDPFPRDFNGEKILKENMVLAFEPHVYLYEGDETVNQNYWGVSARIEDDILIKESGAVILSDDLPIEIHDIEELLD
jgi:Xaa-Pro aminopeptidase